MEIDVVRATGSKYPENGERRDARRRRRRSAALACAAALYLLALVALTAANAAGPERWWWSTVNLYLPQWIWALPALALLAPAARRGGRWLGPALIAALVWVAVPLMGLNWPAGAPGAARAEPAQAGPSSAGLAPASPRHVPLRVMTYNAEWTRGDVRAVARAISAADPDLLLVQDGSGRLRRVLEYLYPEWQMREAGQYLVAGPLPILEAEERPLRLTPGDSGDGGHSGQTYQWCRVRVGTAEVAVYNAHLITPRHGLAALRADVGGGLPRVASNAADRVREAAVLAEAVARERGPVVLAGDLNAPPASLAFRQIERVGLRDAFGAAGYGYGYTFGHSFGGPSFARLDHIFASRAHFIVLRCRTGDAAGGDHRPVIADLLLLGADGVGRGRGVARGE